MDGVAAVAEHDAGVVDGAGGGVELDVADDPGAGLEGEGGEQGLEPAGFEDQVVVEQGEEFALGDLGGAVVGGGVAAVAVVAEDNVGWGEFAEEVAGFVGGTIVDEDDLVVDGGGHGGPERSKAGPGKRELVVKG